MLHRLYKQHTVCEARFKLPKSKATLSPKVLDITAFNVHAQIIVNLFSFPTVHWMENVTVDHKSEIGQKEIGDAFKNVVHLQWSIDNSKPSFFPQKPIVTDDIFALNTGKPQVTTEFGFDSSSFLSSSRLFPWLTVDLHKVWSRLF